MMISKTKLFISNFYFSTPNKQFYDCIFIGPIATILAKQFFQKTKGQFSCLVINSHMKFKHPATIPLRFQPILVSDITNRMMDNCDLRIKKIIPEQSKIQYPDGNQIGYRQLIFTENNAPDLSRIQNLNQSLKLNPYSMVFDNDALSDLNELFNICTGQIVFNIPKGRHVGWDDNYLFLYLYKYLKQKNNKDKNCSRFNLKVKVVLGGRSFFPYHLLMDNFLRQLLLRNQIQIIQNTQVKSINYFNRKLTLSNGKQLNYTAFYNYTSLTQPKQLTFDALDINKQTFRHNKYNNITIFGSSEVPTTHSNYAIKYQIRIIRQNLINSLLRIPIQFHYKGQTGIFLWKSNKQAAFFCHDYQKYRMMDGLGISYDIGRMIGLIRKCSLQLQLKVSCKNGFGSYIRQNRMKEYKIKNNINDGKYEIQRKRCD